jgi:ZIP family zinc transporter
MLLGLARSWSSRLIGLVLAFGAGALVSAVSFEPFEERRRGRADSGYPTSA